MSKINIPLQQMGLERGSCRLTVHYILHAYACGISSNQCKGIFISLTVEKYNYLNQCSCYKICSDHLEKKKGWARETD